jgi:membrane protein DedA with SNARE-associated domain
MILAFAMLFAGGMILAFAMLFAGGMLLGGAWSFYRSKKPWWATAGLAVLALVCLGISFWRIQSG